MGKFVIVEGGDGAGKTTFVNAVREQSSYFVYSREPGGPGFSGLIRELVLSDPAKDADPLAMFNLFWASRAQNIATVIRPALQHGKVVISDRFDASTYAFQISQNPHLEELFWQMRMACLGEIEPVYINFDVSPEVSRRRMSRREEKNHFDRRNSEFRNRVRSYYNKFFADKRIKSITLDANLPQDQLISRGMGALRAAFGMS